MPQKKETPDNIEQSRDDMMKEFESQTRRQRQRTEDVTPKIPNNIDNMEQSRKNTMQLFMLQSKLAGQRTAFLTEYSRDLKEIEENFLAINKQAGIPATEIRKVLSELDKFKTTVAGIRVSDVVDPDVAKEYLKAIQDTRGGIQEVIDGWFTNKKEAQGFLREFTQGMGSVTDSHDGVVDKVVMMRRHWGEVKTQVGSFADNEVQQLDDLYGKLGDKQTINNMKMTDLVATLQQVDELNKRIAKKMGEQEATTVGTQESFNKYLEDQKNAQRLAGAEGAEKGGPGVGDVMRGAGQIPGLEMVGQLGGIISGGFVAG